MGSYDQIKNLVLRRDTRFCQKDFIGPENLKSHEMTHKSTDLKCKFCNKTFGKLYLVKKHEKRVHGGKMSETSPIKEIVDPMQLCEATFENVQMDNKTDIYNKDEGQDYQNE